MNGKRRCEVVLCISPTLIRCHASCCQGETWLCEDHEHLEQWWLDQNGYPSGYFGDQHPLVVELLGDARRDIVENYRPRNTAPLKSPIDPDDR